MPRKSHPQKPHKPTPSIPISPKSKKSPRRPLFKPTYLILFAITGTSIAIPPAITANLLPNSNIGALTMIGSVAVLMLVLVVEIWRQTAKKTGPRLQAQMMAARKRRKKYFA